MSETDAGRAPSGHRRTARRVTTAPPPGSDPAPSAEPPRHQVDDNDERLRAEKPPHY
ncbi:MAG: hypothetical protein KIT89_12735 [Microcella sp.]|uniref:hypothetical protein n=1 Tax=Microcella sp. TaxID=1913979 RepID=UPI0024C85669|nr:hypothetical protein [Microcella sp.]UYN83527.1 MAG: hypothetical protein KIT89_12735 [Microcella sp.]